MALLQTLVSFFNRKILRRRRDRWNHQYQKGLWEGLKDREESERLDAVVVLLRRYAPKSRILEMGCGEALLQRQLRDEDYTRLVGIDIADVAIERANAVGNAKTKYLVADMDTFQPAETFDAIVFTESINYVEHRDQLLRRYAGFLSSEGVFIISIFEHKHSSDMWREIENALQPTDEIRTTNARGSWVCKSLIIRN